MKRIKKLLRKIDLFGVPITFKYKTEDTYTTSFGGFILILFGIVVVYFVANNLPKFINRKNFTTIYYTVNIPKTESISLKDSHASFSLGLDCTSNGRFKAEDVLTLEARYVNYTKTETGEYAKNKTLVPSHYCTYQDFYNIHNDAFNRMKLQNFQCLDDYGPTLAGIYSDHIFTYFEFSVIAKYDTFENFNNIDEYLFENDCKLQIVYVDINIDLNNYNDPIKSYLNEVFVQLNPTLYIKRNMFFMYQYLTDDDDLLFGSYNELKISKVTALYSRYEEYSLYLGQNRYSTNPPDKTNYAKLYMRADTKKTDIRRTYQNIMEFYADVSSLLIGIFTILVFLLNYINNFYAEYSFSKRVFIFKDLENSHFNLNKKYKKINELKNMLSSFNENDTETSSFESNFGDFYQNKKIFKQELTTMNNRYKQRHLNNEKEKEKKKTTYSNKIIKNLIKDSKDNSSNKMKDKLSNFSFSKMDNTNKKGNNINNDESDRHNFNVNLDNSHIIKEEMKPKEIKNKYYFNLFEIIIISLFKCKLPTSLSTKKNLNEKTTNIIYNKLDVVFYLRKMLFMEMMNEIVLNPNKVDIINFLSRPILSGDKIKEKESNENDNDNKEIDFDKFYYKISELFQKPEKTQKEKNLLFLSQQKMLEIE